MTPKITAVIPAYNSEKFIEGALTSVLAQSLLPEEILVVDDGSTDRTQTVVEGFITRRREQRPVIKYIRQANGGPSAARNTGIKQAAGEYVAFLDSDDRWMPERLARQMEIFNRAGDVGLVCSGRYRIEDNGARDAHCIGETLTSDSYRDLWTQGNYIVTSSVLARKSVLMQAGLFDEDRRAIGSEDMDLWLRVAELCRMEYVDEPLVEYRVRSDGLNRSNIQRSYDSASFVIRKHQDRISGRFSDAEEVLREKWFNFYFQWGLTLIDENQFSQAHEKFGEAMKHRRDARAGMYWLVTALGENVLRRLKTLKRKVRI